MSTLKIQFVRSCVQCGDVLSTKCKGCIKHPERQPRVVEFYDWPEILETNSCGCIRIRCQLEGCSVTMWRYRQRNGQHGLPTSKNFYCSVPHSARAAGLGRVKKIMVPCASCSKPVQKKNYAIKTWKRSFCNRTCYFIFRAKERHSLQEKAVADRKMERCGTDGRALIECFANCKGRGLVTEHLETGRGVAKCTLCGTSRKTTVHMMVA